MDIDLLKSTPDSDQIEMMLMMHMENKSSSPSDPLTAFMESQGPISSSPFAPHFQNNYLTTPHHQSLSSSPFPNTLPHQNTFPCPSSPSSQNNNNNNKQTSMAAMREMIFRIAAMQPIYIDPESVKPPKRRNVRISKDPQSVAARHRRERISERIRILQRLVPGGTKMDTASMLDEAIHYVKFLKTQVQSLERAAVSNNRPGPMVGPGGVGFPVGGTGYFPMSSGGNVSKVNNNGGYNSLIGAHANHHHQQFSDA